MIMRRAAFRVGPQRVERRDRRRWVHLLFGVASTMLLTSMLRAQTTGTLVGTVTDPQKLAVAGAQVQVNGKEVTASRSVMTDAHGAYRIAALEPGTYSVTVSQAGFSTEVVTDVQLTLNRTVTVDVSLNVGSAREQVEVSGRSELIDTTTSSTGLTIMPEQIHDIPLNGRNYLDLLQMVPGVTVNRQADLGSDNAVSILGERGNNTGYLIDGLSNENQVTGGAAAQFNQDTISEFQVITSGYKAEFGHSSGGIVNVITRSGGQDLHGLASVFLRNNVFDSSDIPGTSVPYLLRWDYDAALGGPIVKDKLFWFASAERIHQNEQLNFVVPPGTPDILVQQEKAYGRPAVDRETRVFGKLSEVVGRHVLAEEMNYTNAHVGNFLPLSQSTSLPSTRQNTGYRTLLFGVTDTATLGDRNNPYVLNLYGQFRGEPSSISPAHPEAGPNTIFNIFSDYNTGGIFGDLGEVQYGSLTTITTLNQKYGAAGANMSKVWKRNTFKFGYDYLRTQVDGVEGSVNQDQLFATLPDYAQYGPINSGFFLLATTGGATPQASEIHLRNNYSGMFFQDDLKLSSKLTINAGLRWDFDSAFKIKTNFSPRVGFSWSATPQTIVRGSFGVFYDHFRLGLARDIPAFGGATLETIQPLSYPRLFYGVPTIAPALFGLCLSETQTDAQLAGSGATCPYSFLPNGAPIYGVDHLNNVVAGGHAPIPANSVVNQANIQQLSGLDPATYLTSADAAIGQQAGYLFWGPYGALSYLVNPAGTYPVTLDPSFATPYTRSYSLGAQRQVSAEAVISLDYYHKDIQHILGVRQTNLPFASRMNNDFTGAYVNGFGPWYSGKYDSGILSFEKRISHRYTVGGSYQYTSENDDADCSNLSPAPSATCYPTDSFRGTTTLVTDPKTGQTNANGAFTASNGNYVPKAGIYYDGAKLDKGPSDFSLRHTFQAHGTVRLPLRLELSSVFRVQSGFRYTASAVAPIDQDGNGNFGIRDLQTGRNQFQAPHYLNQDLRVARTFTLRDRFKIEPIFEFFNLYNSANPAAIQIQQSTGPAFGTVSQTLPGRQGQAALRIEF